MKKEKTECKSVKIDGKMVKATCKVNGKKLSEKESMKLMKKLQAQY